MEWMSDGQEDQTLSPEAAFRRHRHDVLNQLQLIRARVQMGQGDRALLVLDRTALWLQSLGTWQSHLPVHAHSLLWRMAECSHVLTEGIIAKPESFTPDVVHSLQEIFKSVEENANLRGDYPRVVLRCNPAHSFANEVSSQDNWEISLQTSVADGFDTVVRVYQTELGVPITVKVV